MQSFLGYVLSGPPHYAMPAIAAPCPFQLPFLPRDLVRSSGRINFHPNYGYAPNGDDLPGKYGIYRNFSISWITFVLFSCFFLVTDKPSLRFYYNLGVEYFKLLQNVYGTGQVMAMIDGEPLGSNNNYEQQPNEIDTQQNQLVGDLQQLSFESNDVEIQSPSKVKLVSTLTTIID